MDGLTEQNREILKTALDRYDTAMEFEREQRDLGSEDLCFLHAEQWPDNVKRDRLAKDRPCLTFNRLPQFTQQVVGDARQNRPAIKVNPVDEGADIETSDIYEGLVRNIEAQSRATQAYITALEHSVGCGFGHWRVMTQYASDDAFDQDIRIKRITDPFAVSWDPASKEYDKSDANWCFVVDWVSRETFEAKYPDHAPSSWEDAYKGLHCKEEWSRGEDVRIAEYWVKKPTEIEIGLTRDGRTERVMPGVTYRRTRKVVSHKVCRYVLSGHAVLEEEREFPCRYIPIVSVFGPEEYVDGRLRPRSLIRYAKDPQRMYNYWQSTIAEKIALAPKSPWLVTPKMIAGHEQAWNAANRENRAYLPYNPDAEAGRPERQQPAHVNPAELQQSAQAIDDLKATMGMYDASLGNQSNETSGRAIIARQREGDMASFAWIDNLARSIAHTGRILVDMIPRIYDTERVVRVLGVDDSVEMVLINRPDGMGSTFNDMTLGKYDVEVTVGPSYATKRLEAADSMMAFIQAIPAAAQVAGDLIAKNMDWPGADDIADRLKKLLPPGVAEDEEEGEEDAQTALLMQQIEQMAQQMEGMAAELQKYEQMELEKTEAETDRADADTALKYAQAEKTLEEAEHLRVEREAVEAGIIEGIDIESA